MNTPTVRTFTRAGLTATLYLGDCLEIAPTLTGVDCVISDPPFSEKAHAGHDAVISGQYKNGDGANRRALEYKPWTDVEVSAMCLTFPRHGWVCVLTDHILARDWALHLEAVGRYVFAPLPLVVNGRSVRLSGDGPSSWADWIIASRTAKESRWGTLPGAYNGRRGTIQHMGGKPLCAMARIVQDYSRHGNTVLDFCMGSGTTGIACLRTGRNFIGIEIDPNHYKTACDRIEQECRQGVLI